MERKRLPGYSVVIGNFVYMDSHKVKSLVLCEKSIDKCVDGKKIKVITDANELEHTKRKPRMDVPVRNSYE